MAPCFLSHISHDSTSAGPFWSVALQAIAVFVFGAFFYLARMAKKEQRELDLRVSEQEEVDRLNEAAKQHSRNADESCAELVRPPSASHPPLFVLVGDSTTADQAAGGGGWGAGFISLLARGAGGVNYGRNGATTRDYIKFGVWDEVLDVVREAAPTSPVHVTIQFGHNDQIPSRGVSLDDYRHILVRMARDILAAGGTPILLSPLARRDFDADGVIIDNLHDYRVATQSAFKEVSISSSIDSSSAKSGLRPRFCDLNAASLAYVAALGSEDAQRYNLHNGDTTHLSSHGSIVFGRMVADLLLGHPPTLVKSGHRDKWAPGSPGSDSGDLAAWIKPSPLLSSQIWHGQLA